MKAVLISIHPEWCEKITSGEKTLEVRKNRPKLETPFKCYIYRAKGKVKHIMNGKWVDMPVGGDVAYVRHGRWRVDGVYVVCSVCNRLTLSPIIKQLPTFKYCPNCGAKMDLEV